MPYRPAIPVQMRGLLLSLILIVTTQGCANNLQAIQEFAQTSAESAEYTALVENYIEFPTRQQRYQPPSRHARLEDMSQQRAAQKEELLLRQALIETYMQALGHLAADELVDNSQEVARLSAALRTQAGIGGKETEAAEKVATLLTTVATDRWRQNRLRDLIERSNPHIQHLLDSLQQIVSQGFGGDLQTEEAAINNYYGTLMMESSDPAGKAALGEWKEFRQAQIQARARAVDTYHALLQNISDGHQELYDQRNNLKKTEVLQRVRQAAKHVRSLLKNLKQL